MSATNLTPHASLPQFSPNDVPTFSVDVNNAMSLIDSAIYSAKQDSISATNEANTALTNSANNTVSITGISTALEEHDEQIGTLQGGQSTLRQLITNTELKNETQDNRINSLETNIGTDIGKLTADNGELFQFAYSNSKYGYMAKINNVSTFIAFS